MSATLKKQIRRALADSELQSALSSFTAICKIGRQYGMKGVDFEELRRDLRSRKEKSIEDLPELLQRFKENAISAGAVVHEAADASAANAYIAKLAKERSVRHIVKTKSMLGEEIGLREYLEKRGVEVVETDIGERIVQLAGEKPSHIVGPAIHKTVGQIAQLLSKATGREISTDGQELLDTIRTSLRRAYIEADMGISGANIALAETGSLVIVTNEGNGQLVTTLSPLHVAVVGIEKLMDGFDDANAMLRLLSRSCTGAGMTSYVSFITGVSSAGSIGDIRFPGGQGPLEMHIVLVDNGRTELRNSGVFREALYCVRCGACLNVCPVFASVAGQTYGHIYQGGIGTILTAFYHHPQRARELSDMCMGCMACKNVCPVSIDTPNLIRELRQKHVIAKGLAPVKRIVYRGIMEHPARMETTAQVCSVLQRPFVDRDGMVRKLPYPASAVTDSLSLPSIASNRLLKRMRGHTSPAGDKRPIAALYAGCVTAYAYPKLGEDVIKALGDAGTTPYYPEKQACCGAPAYFSGDSGSALELARHNIAALLESDPDFIVTVCPGCAAMLKNEYPKLTVSDAALYEKALKLAGKVRDFSQLMVELSSGLEKKTQAGTKVTYHDPCHLKRGLGISAEPRKLIRDAGYELVEMNDADACCGFGGDALLSHPELCGAILKRKIANIEATGVDTVVTACTACVLQLRGGLDKKKSPIRVVHVAELLTKP